MGKIKQQQLMYLLPRLGNKLMKEKNLFEFDLNKSSKACDPCALECKKINEKINERKLSELKNKEVSHILNIFESKK